MFRAGKRSAQASARLVPQDGFLWLFAIYIILAWANRSAHGVVNGSQSSGLVNFVPESRFVTVCTNQSHLPENGGEGLKLVSKIIKALKKCNTNFSLEYSIRKTDYLFRCSVAPGNFPLGRAKKSCSIYSLLGPRFVSYYVYNLTDEVTEGELAMSADDTTLSVVETMCK